MRIHLLLTGNELMAGDIVDSNSAMIAQRLAEYGLGIGRKVTVGDDLDALVKELRQMAADADIVLVNGGLGPTVDDLTAAALATAAGVGLAEHPEAMAHLEHWCAKLGLELNAANRKQALLPAGADVIPNPVGTAVGFGLMLDHCQVLCTPGVPRELERMLNDTLIPRLAANRGAVSTRKLTFFGIGESSLQQLLSDNIPDWPDDIELGFRAGFPLMELKLTIRSTAAEAGADALQRRILELAGGFLVGVGAVTPAERLVALLKQQGKRLCLAESCTGGAIAARITAIAGASEVFEAGLVTYSNAMKTELLGVPESLLEQHGAVSEAVVRAMAAGALARSGADCVIGISGIAGPGGGSEDKPVGTVWIAWGDISAIHAHRFNLALPRHQFQELATTLGLDLLRRHLLGIEAPPALFRDRR